MEAHWRRFAVRKHGNSHPSAQETNRFRDFANQVSSDALNESRLEMALQTQQVIEVCFESARQGSRLFKI